MIEWTHGIMIILLISIGGLLYNILMTMNNEIKKINVEMKNIKRILKIGQV